MVYLFLANGFEEIEALCPLDLLRRVGVDVTTVGIGTDCVTGSHGITVHADIPDTCYRDSTPEMVILPGGMPGTTNLDKSPVVDAALKAAVRNDAYIAAICAAPLVLGKRGLLRGLRATCFPGFEGDLEGAVEIGGSVVQDGRIITARGMGVAQEFGLELVRALRGDKVADELRAAIQA